MNQSAVITGIFGLLSILLGYFLRPAEKAIFNAHCDIGGVWIRSENGLKGHCEIVKFEDGKEFWIKSQGSFGGEEFLLSGKGNFEGSVGTFIGNFILTNNKDGSKSETQLSGQVGLQGCNSIGVKLDKEQAYIWSYVRDTEFNFDQPIK